MNRTQKEFLLFILYIIGFILTVVSVTHFSIPLLRDEYGQLNGVLAGIVAGTMYNIVIMYLYLNKGIK